MKINCTEQTICDAQLSHLECQAVHDMLPIFAGLQTELETWFGDAEFKDSEFTGKQW
jgi:hypothetical protein